MPLIVDRPGEGLEDRIACTVLGMAEHRVTAVAPDHEGLAGLKRTPVGVVSVRGIAAILGIVDRQSFTGPEAETVTSKASTYSPLGLSAQIAILSPSASTAAKSPGRHWCRPDCPSHLGVHHPHVIDQIKRNHSIEAKFKADILVDGEPAGNEMLRQRRCLLLPQSVSFSKARLTIGDAMPSESMAMKETVAARLIEITDPTTQFSRLVL